MNVFFYHGRMFLLSTAWRRTNGGAFFAFVHSSPTHSVGESVVQMSAQGCSSRRATTAVSRYSRPSSPVDGTQALVWVVGGATDNTPLPPEFVQCLVSRTQTGSRLTERGRRAHTTRPNANTGLLARVDQSRNDRPLPSAPARHL